MHRARRAHPSAPSGLVPGEAPPGAVAAELVVGDQLDAGDRRAGDVHRAGACVGLPCCVAASARRSDRRTRGRRAGHGNGGAPLVADPVDTGELDRGTGCEGTLASSADAERRWSGLLGTDAGRARAP
jgi:hypothetical protein